MNRRLLRAIIALLVLLLFGTVLLPRAWAQEGSPTPSPEAEITATPEAGAATPEATPALSIEIGESLSDAAASLDLSSLEPIDLLRLIVAIAIIAVFLLFGRRIVSNLLHRVAKRTESSFDDELIERIQGQIRWLVIIIGIDIGTFILFFDNEAIKDVFANVIFWFYYGILFSAAYTTLHFFFEWYEKQLEGDENRIAVFLPILRRFSMVLLIIFAAVILLDHLGINVTGLAAAAALVGLAIALAAQDIIGDLISGYVILMDRPFRVGDRIEIPDQDSWGDVVEIGTRTTRIRTRDNNLVIIPNSSIADGEVLNYTYPDPNYRLQQDIGIEYGEDLDNVRQVFGDAVRSVDEVLKDKPVQVLFIDFGNSSMTIRVRWWIDTYSDKRVIQDKVNTALQEAIDRSGIISPNPALDLNVKMKSGSKEDL